MDLYEVRTGTLRYFFEVLVTLHERAYVIRDVASSIACAFPVRASGVPMLFPRAQCANTYYNYYTILYMIHVITTLQLRI